MKQATRGCLALIVAMLMGVGFGLAWDGVFAQPPAVAPTFNPAAVDPVTFRAPMGADKPPIDELPIKEQMTYTWQAIAQVESGWNSHAFNKAEGARGVLQIRPIMVKDCNRIVGEERWTNLDTWDNQESIRMFKVYCLHYAPSGPPERWARMWNGGPDGHTEDATIAYWARVADVMAQWADVGTDR